MTDFHALTCQRLNWYADASTPCTCPPGTGMDPDGEYVIEKTPDGPRIVPARETDDQVLTLGEASEAVQEWEDTQWRPGPASSAASG